MKKIWFWGIVAIIKSEVFAKSVYVQFNLYFYQGKIVSRTNCYRWTTAKFLKVFEQNEIDNS